MTGICLNMIVKNEAERIERCLASVAPVVSSYAIMDTGSADPTPQIIRDFFGARDTPGRVWDGPFVNYRDARNLALEGARKLRGDLSWQYLLLVDADMELVAPGGLGELTEPGYQVLQRAGMLEYWNARLLRYNNKAQYICPTHEYLSVEFPLTNLHGAWFLDHSDGANRPGKIERDIVILSAELEKNPNDGRCWFYLGNSFRELHRHEEAIDAYEKRIAIGGWEEEVFCSLLYASRCARALGR